MTHRHHVIPQRLGVEVDKTVPLCPTCHTKVHELLDPLVEYLNGKSPDVEEDNEERLGDSLTHSQKDLLKTAKTTIENNHEDSIGCPQSLLTSTLHELDYTTEDIEWAIGWLKNHGEIYTPKEGYMRVT